MESRAGVFAIDVRDRILESARILGEGLPVRPPLDVVRAERFHEQECVLTEEPAKSNAEVDRPCPILGRHPRSRSSAGPEAAVTDMGGTAASRSAAPTMRSMSSRRICSPL